MSPSFFYLPDVGVGLGGFSPSLPSIKGKGNSFSIAPIESVPSRF